MSARVAAMMAAFFCSPGCGSRAAAAAVTLPAPDTSGAAGVSVRSFGAACDGDTDDSAALQSALDAAAAQGFALLVPVGHCNFSRTLSVNAGPRGVAIRGQRGQGEQGSYLRYTGSETALRAQNGAAFVYNLVFESFGLVAGAQARLGFDAKLLSEAKFRNFTIAGSGGSFALAWKCAGCNILLIEGLILSGNGAGIDFVDPAAVFISGGDFFEHAGYVLKFEGTVTHLVVRDSWFEKQDFALVFDTPEVSMAEITGNRFLFNGGSAFANQVGVEIRNSGGGAAMVRGFHFAGNSGYCAARLCAAPFFIQVDVAGPSVTAWVEHNVVLGTALLGGASAASTARVHATDNEAGAAP